MEGVKRQIQRPAVHEEVMEHCNRAPEAPEGHSELMPLGLTGTEVEQVEAFLGTLSGGVESDAKWLKEPAE